MNTAQYAISMHLRSIFVARSHEMFHLVMTNVFLYTLHSFCGYIIGNYLFDVRYFLCVSYATQPSGRQCFEYGDTILKNKKNSKRVRNILKSRMIFHVRNYRIWCILRQRLLTFRI